MKTVQTDVAVIGAGTAGLNARREAEKAGKDWVLIESGPYGTMCAREGCMPSKLLIAAADRAHQARQGAIFGVHAGPDGPTVDGPAVLERVRRERDRFAGAVVRSTEALDESRRLRGRARFEGPNTLVVGEDTRVEAGAVVLATGSRPWIPPSLDEVRDDVMLSSDVFELEDLPASIAVVGTGVIALELGQALDRLGVRTAFFNPFDEVGPFTEPAVHDEARKIFGSDLELHLRSEIEVRRDDGGFVVRYRDADGHQGEGRFERVLAAAGRRPVLAELQLERAGLELDERGRPPWDPCTMQCGETPVFLAGDVTGSRPLLHEASDEGRIAGANAARYPEVTRHGRRTPLAIAFTDPQMAVVGERWADVDPEQVAVGEVSYEKQGRARVMAENRGLVRIWARGSDCTLLGAEMLGPAVEHTAHLLAWAVQQKLGVQQALAMPVYHPVVEEGIRTALRSLAKQLEVFGGCPPADHGECPGD